jgi:hypothetical protein
MAKITAVKSFIVQAPGDFPTVGSRKCAQTLAVVVVPCKRIAPRMKIKLASMPVDEVMKPFFFFPGVNFTNILWAAFAPKSFRKKLQTQIVST